MKSECYHIFMLLSALALLLHVHAAAPVVATDGTPISPGASLFSHWHRLLPGTKIPGLLISRSSPLTATQVATFSSYFDTHTLNTPAHLSAFCSAAKILCSDNLQREGVRHTEAIFGVYGGGNRNYASGLDLPVSVHDMTSLEPGLFFHKTNITTGRKIRVPDIHDKAPDTYFLPKQLSDKLPFSTKSLPGLVELLGASRMQSDMSTTVTTCELPPLQGERKSCMQSIEDMANFVAEALGPKGEELVTHSTDVSGQDATVGAVIPRNGGKETPTVACHRMFFPYMVYYCHMFPSVKLYNVELLMGDGAEQKRNQLLAICHMDPSGWSANHVAFTILGSKPGETEACHFFFDSAIIWAVRD